LLVFFHYVPPLTFTPLLKNPGENLAQLIWPALTVGYRYSAVATRMTRSTLLEVLRDDYVRTARAKGLREQAVVGRHVMRNALLPVVTALGAAMGALLGGAVATETAFGVPGLGSYLVQALNSRDWTVIQNLVLIYGTIAVITNILVDLSYAWIDPRIRYG
jgi:peptide/nickel transport system permease protein